MALNINTVVDVSLIAAGASLQPESPNNVALFTSNAGQGLSESNRWESFRSLSSVASYFGTGTPEYQIAATIFGTSPNNINAGGSLVFSYVGGEFQQGQAPTLSSGAIPDTVVSTLSTVTDGYLTINLSGTQYNLTGLDFSGATFVTDIFNTVSNAISLSGMNAFASFASAGSSFFIDIIGGATGSSETISYATDEALAGTYVGDILLLDSAGASFLAPQGTDGISTLESPQAAFQAAIDANAPFVAAMFMDQPTGTDLTVALPSLLNAYNKLLYVGFNPTDNPNILNTDDQISGAYAAQLVSAGAKKVRMLFVKKNTLGTLVHTSTYMAKAHSVNVDRTNSALTMHLKQLNITPDDISETEYNAAQENGMAVYTNISTIVANLESGANGWTDEEFFKVAFVNAVKVAYFNALSSTRTRVNQTQSGLAVLENSAVSQCIKYANSGFIGGGQWNSNDFFGDEETFKRKIEQQGFFVKAESLALQDQAQREARIAPPLNVAVKYTGAFHSGTVFITFEA